jgi:hypothetical protein
MVAIPFPPSSAPSKFAESGGRLINVYAEKLPDGRIARRRVPGLRQLLGELPFDVCRGFINVNGVLLTVVGTRLFKVTLSGGAFTATDLGAIGGSGPVFFARNNKSPTPDIVAVADSTPYEIDLTSGPSGYSDGDVGSPNSVISQGGYFVFSYGEGRMRHTDLNSVAINTLDTAFAETRPDGLLRVVNSKSEIVAFGQSSTEIWRNTGNSPGFVYTYVDTLERGLMTQRAVSGHEPGFADYGPMWLGDDGICYRFEGYRAVRFSTHTQERLIAKVANRASFEALSYIHDGHPCWVLTCDEWTWVYDLSTGIWYERQSHLRDRWRATSSVWCFDRWIVGDDATGFLFTVEPEAFDEGGSPLTATIISATMSGFPRRARWSSLELDIMSGVGIAPGLNPIEVAPQARVSWSLDGGVSFGSPVTRELGEQGNYSRDILLNRLGMVSDRGAQVRIDVSDPVAFTLFGGEAMFGQLKS